MFQRPGIVIFGAASLVVGMLAPQLATAANSGGSGYGHGSSRQQNWSGYAPRSKCPEGPTCAELYQWPGQYYTGHDEPSVLFYSSRSGAGNDMTYQLYLPTDPTTPPQNGGTANFELHPTFWLGLAMCDSQSAPNPGGSGIGPEQPCAPDSDSNVYNNSNPASPRYIGLHPGTAFMEMQFYAPGWVEWPPGDSCDATKWCAALNIDSYSENMNTGTFNNSACLDTVGPEPVNFAFITKNGKAQGPANPVDATAATYTPNSARDLFMSSGDHIQVHMFDTAAGFQVDLTDLTTGHRGSMTASKANGFGQVNYAPAASTCTVTPYAFHPMYATSSPDTRVPWAAHSYNVAFADEVGHFEFCDNGYVSPDGDCLQSTRTDPDGVDADDVGCYPNTMSSAYPVSGCLGADTDFDGPPYLKDWPGTGSASPTPTPIRFTSPLIEPSGANYSQIAFEADLPRIEEYTTPACQRHVSPADPEPGAGCVNPPAGAAFYPFYSTWGTGTVTGCLWQIGGPSIPGTDDNFGGSSASEYGNRATGHMLTLFYPGPGGSVTRTDEDFRNIQSTNPCPA